MPDHAHLLVRGMAATSDLRRFVKTAKERSGRAYRKRCDKRLWQEGYFERVLRDDSEARRYARYIVTDPVRAGLVASVAEYEHVGTTEWTIDELTNVSLDEPSASQVMHAGPKSLARPTPSRNCLAAV